MKVITVVSAKGGVGKTTLAANLASVLAARGRRVIALDLDPQNALRLHFGIPLDSIDGLARATLAGDPWQTVMSTASTTSRSCPTARWWKMTAAALSRTSTATRSGSRKRWKSWRSMPRIS
jgi:CO dehydrogenase nickel-insertion accessory protein CooC1